jgi:hypothetical protein
MNDAFLTPDIMLAVAGVVAAVGLLIRAIAGGLNRYGKTRESAALWQIEAERGKVEIERLRLEAQRQDQERNDTIIQSMISSHHSLVEGLQDLRKSVDNGSSITMTFEKTIGALLEQGQAHTRELQAMRQDLNAWPKAVASSLEIHDSRVSDLDRHIVELTSIMKDFITEAARSEAEESAHKATQEARLARIVEWVDRQQEGQAA